jgi:DNA-binding CsgD family transcriptional regulator
MKTGPADELTPRERECLILVGRGRSSKEIALELHIAPKTVDKYVEIAVQKLRASNRREAARVLADREQDAPEKFRGELEAVVPAADLRSQLPPEWTDQGSRFRFPFLRQGRQFNDLRPAQRLLWILFIAIGSLIAVGNFFYGIEGVRQIAIGMKAPADPVINQTK